MSKPNFASNYALESSRRDLHNALLCTVLESNPKKRGKEPFSKLQPDPHPRFDLLLILAPVVIRLRAPALGLRRRLPKFVLAFFSNFWYFLANFERPVLDSIEADFASKYSVERS